MQPDAMAMVQPSLSLECEIIQEFRQRVGLQTFDHWFRDKVSIEIAPGNNPENTPGDILGDVPAAATVRLANGFLLSWMQNRFRAEIVGATRCVLGESVEVCFKVRSLGASPPLVATRAATAAPTPGPARQAVTTAALVPAVLPSGQVNPRPIATNESASFSARPAVCQLGDVVSVKLPRIAQSAKAGAFVHKTSLAAARIESARSDTVRPETARPHGVQSASTIEPASPNPMKSNRSDSGSRKSTKPIVSKTKPVNTVGGNPIPGTRRFADLSDFVKGTCNELALTAVLHVCEQPGLRYNPLVLHGGVGTGKTHLLEAVHRRLRASHTSLRVLFISAETFANCFTQALRDRSLPSFRQRFRTVDVLIVDDVDFLDGKRVIQEEFLHTVKQLEAHGRQIILSADRHPRLLTKLSEELVTRFISGIVCRIESPDVETRRTIVARKAARLSARISDDALEFVVQRFGTSVRQLEGAINCLESYGLLSGKNVGITAARQVLADLERDCGRVVRVSDVEHTVSQFFGVPVDELRSSRRSRSVSQPRMLAMYLARKMTQAAYSEIGEYFGGRNHSTVMSAEKRVRELVAAEATVRVAAHDWKLGDLLNSLEQQLMVG